MTITEKWQKMLNSFADIKAAIEEKGVSVGGYSDYAKGVHSICYSSSYTPKYSYPEESLEDKLKFCNDIKEEIRKAIVGGGLSCGVEIPLSEYGDIIRKLNRFEFVKTMYDVQHNVPCFVAVEVTGGMPPYTFSATGMPPGLTLSSDGIISGTGTVSGGYLRVYIYCTDSTGRCISAKTRVNVNKT